MLICEGFALILWVLEINCLCAFASFSRCQHGGKAKPRLGLSMFIFLAFRRKIKCAGTSKNLPFFSFSFQSIIKILQLPFRSGVSKESKPQIPVEGRTVAFHCLPIKQEFIPIIPPQEKTPLWLNSKRLGWKIWG